MATRHISSSSSQSQSTFQPDRCIFYSRDQVALMVRIASALNPRAVRRGTKETAARINQMADGLIDPSPAILCFFDLTRQGERFCWQVELTAAAKS
jgi:hypothetical protein